MAHIFSRLLFYNALSLTFFVQRSSALVQQFVLYVETFRQHLSHANVSIKKISSTFPRVPDNVHRIFYTFFFSFLVLEAKYNERSSLPCSSEIVPLLDTRPHPSQESGEAEWGVSVGLRVVNPVRPQVRVTVVQCLREWAWSVCVCTWFSPRYASDYASYAHC